MDKRSLIRWAVDPAALMRDSGTVPDGWQADLLRKAQRPGARCLCLTARQSGKSTTLSALATHWALLRPRYDVLIIAPTLRQASELIFRCRSIMSALGIELRGDAATKLEVAHSGGRIIALAGSGHIRGMTAGLVLADEMAWISESVMFGSVLPMLASIPGGGRMVCCTTPAGQRGVFYKWWTEGGDAFDRWKIPYTQVKRISPEFVEAYRRAAPRQVFAAELECSFEASGGGLWDPALIDSMFIPEGDEAQVPVRLPRMPAAPWAQAA